MTRDTLERERVANNLIDEVRAMQTRLARLEEMVRTLSTRGQRVLVPQVDSPTLWELMVDEAGTDDGMAWLVMQEL